jgi:iron complex outermembrane receptor protein
MMRKLLGTVAFIFIALHTSAQFKIEGKVISSLSKESLENITLQLDKDGKWLTTIKSDKDGKFAFNGLAEEGSYLIFANSINMQKKEVKVTVSSVTPLVMIEMQQATHMLEPLEVKSLRATERTPFTTTNLSQADLSKSNLGQDLPFLLNQTPGVVVNSDAGNGVGYTGIQIRGTDATRINMTINGIPYNDPESHGIFLVNLPDFASSVNSLQIQRGVGTSTNGGGAFGATLNLSTNQYNEKPYAEFNNSFGSFITLKNTVKVGSGLINDHFTVDARLSRISSDGYIDRAWSDLRSLYFSTAYLANKTSVRFNIFSGREATYQAWNGVPEEMLKTNRTYNSAGTARPGDPYNNETDNYGQDHYQLFFNHSLNSSISFNTGLFLVNGKGYYEQYRNQSKFSSIGLPNPVINGTEVSRTDLVRQLWLDNSFYGQIFSLQYNKGKNEVTIGGGWNRYNGDHFGAVSWAQVGVPKDHRFYENAAVKGDENVYLKWLHSLNNRFSLFADVQYRHVGYSISGFRDNPNVPVDRTFNFINPKAGISYNYRGVNTYLSYAIGNKEPNRNDFEAGITQQPKHETLHDFELGFEKRFSRYTIGATGYYMLYKNQLILTGEINDVGAYTRANIPNSYRMGVELQASAKVASWVNAQGNIAFSRNKIKTFTEFNDDYDAGDQKRIEHSNTTIAFSPSVVSAATINFIPVKNAEISLISKYVGKQYLDNTQSDNRKLNEYYLQDVRFTYTIKNKLLKQLDLIVLVNNVFNRLYEANGYTFTYIADGRRTTENYYYPMAGTNFLAGVNVRL